MARRKSIEVAGFGHANPIPAASRVGNLLMSGAISGIDPTTRKVPPTLEVQCANMFGHVRNILAAAGGSPDDVVKMTVWMKDRGQRAALNHEWVKIFPDEHARPARHTIRADLEGDMLIQCDVTAVIG